MATSDPSHDKAFLILARWSEDLNVASAKTAINNIKWVKENTVTEKNVGGREKIVVWLLGFKPWV